MSATSSSVITWYMKRKARHDVRPFCHDCDCGSHCLASRERRPRCGVPLPGWVAPWRRAPCPYAYRGPSMRTSSGVYRRVQLRAPRSSTALQTLAGLTQRVRFYSCSDSCKSSLSPSRGTRTHQSISSAWHRFESLLGSSLCCILRDANEAIIVDTDLIVAPC